MAGDSCGSLQLKLLLWSAACCWLTLCDCSCAPCLIGHGQRIAPPPRLLPAAVLLWLQKPSSLPVAHRIPTFDGMGLKEELLRGIYAYGQSQHEERWQRSTPWTLPPAVLASAAECGKECSDPLRSAIASLVARREKGDQRFF